MGMAKFVPDLATLALLSPLGLLAALLAGALAGWLRRTRGIATPYTRKFFHFAIFSAAAGAHIWKGPSGVAVFGACESPEPVGNNC